MSKPFSVLSELSRDILQYNAIRVTGRVVRGETTDGITLGEGRDGITVGETKDAISSDKLSSGEKQMLSFLCYNAFSGDTAIFIDEPELSLHVIGETITIKGSIRECQCPQKSPYHRSLWLYCRTDAPRISPTL